jgi:hypothetical protein
VTVPIVFPPVIGFGRIEHDQLWAVIGVWLAAVARRAALVTVLYAPVALAAWSLAPEPILAVPFALLAARLCVRVAVAVAAEALDARLVDRDRAEAWHAATQAYVIGYLRRAGLPVDATLLDRVRMLPGKTDAVACYGGGLTDSRIVIPRGMLELALAPAGRPHDYAAPRVSTLHWTQWNAGLVIPAEADVVAMRGAVAAPSEPEGEAERELFGEPPTLAGTIEPSDLDERKTYRPHEDRIWLDWDPGEEHDGTDPGDRDFLFGAIVHALGEIQRHGDRLATFSWLVRRAPRATALADHHAALGGARHHLVQYLAWRASRRDDVLTARAFAPELAAATKKILAQHAGNRRIVRLGDPERPVRWQRFALAGVLVAGVGAAALAVASAVQYHAQFVKETNHE